MYFNTTFKKFSFLKLSLEAGNCYQNTQGKNVRANRHFSPIYSIYFMERGEHIVKTKPLIRHCHEILTYMIIPPPLQVKLI